MKKKKIHIGVKNHMKDKFGTILGQTDTDTKSVNINVKAHRGDRAELASTIKHELLHAKHPKMTEKEAYKRSAKTKITPAEQARLLSKLRDKKTHYQEGAIKRKLGIRKGEKVEPGDYISKMNAQKASRTTDALPRNPEQRTAILGLI